jgi:integrase
MKKAKLREQYKKLMALAEGNSNPHEAEAASEKARELEAILSANNVRGVFEKVPDSNVWWIRYTDASGRYRREKAGTKSAALNLLTKRRNEALVGRKLPESLRRRGVLFSELVDDAIKYVKKEYSRPADDVARLELLKTKFSGCADAITAGAVENVLDSLVAEKHWKASTRNHHHNLLSLAYRLGILHEKVKESPLRGLQRETENNSRVRFLTPEEEKVLRETIRSKPEWAEHEPELTLALHTGLRRSSMYIALVWENVDLLNCTLTIPRTKNGDPIVLPLNADAMQALRVFRARGDGKGRVVRNAAGETLICNAHWFREAVKASGIAPYRWHDNRHTYASRLRQTGTPLGNIAELLGHRGLAMTRRYSHLAISNLHEAVSRISNSTPPAPADSSAAPKEVSVQ